MRIINPATEDILATLNPDTRASIQNKFDAARASQKQWAELALKERISCLASFSGYLEKNAEELSRILTSEVGKPIKESQNEIRGALSRIRYFLDHSEKYLAETRVHESGGVIEVLSFEPLGVVANISAWNYPYLVAMNVIIPALVGGNAVLYKPSEHATLTGLEIANLLHRAGVPAAVFQTVVGSGEQGQMLCDLTLDGYFFTGSCKTGLNIAKAIAHKLVPVGLELGGKDPLYVMDDVTDVAHAAAAAVEGSFYNNGQSCCAVERIYVHEKIHDEFVQNFLSEVKKLRTGDPLDPKTTQGPLTREAQLDMLENQVGDALNRGATLALGGKRLKGRGYYFEPTVLLDVNHNMLVMREESFGPVIGIMKVSDDTAALKLMNDTEYGLTAAVYGTNESRAKKIMSEIHAGTVYFNCCDRVSPYLPWSGRKHSGMGSTLSHLGILAFVRPKGWHIRGVK